jgi:hypothetical protein
MGLQPTSDFQGICEADLRSTPNISALTNVFARLHRTVADPADRRRAVPSAPHTILARCKRLLGNAALPAALCAELAQQSGY